MSDAVRLRRATPQDAPAIAAIAVRAWHHAYADFLDPRTLAERDVESQTTRWRDHLTAGEAETVVAVTSGRVVGYATTGPGGDRDTDATTGGVLALYVDPSAQGAGLGTRLLADAVARLRGAGYRDATLWVFADYGLARRFYERHGWALDSSGAGQEDEGWREPAVRYRREL